MPNNCETKTLLIHLAKPEPGGYDPARSDERVFTMRLGADVVASIVEIIGASEAEYNVVNEFVETINKLWRHDYGCGIIDGDDVTTDDDDERHIELTLEDDDDGDAA